MTDPITIEQLIRASQNCETLDDVTNGDENSNVTSPDGRVYPTIAKALYQVIQSGGYEPFQTEAALLASVPTVPKKAAIALDTFNVFLWESSSWQNKGNSLNTVNSLLINSGKAFPFTKKTKKGITSENVADLHKLILSVIIENADSNYYYTISSFLNGSTAYNPTGWGITRTPKSTFSTTAANEVFVVHPNTAQTLLTKNTGIQKIKLVNANKFDKESISIVVNTDLLKDYGTSYFSSGDTQFGYSYVLDEAVINYDPTIKVIDSLSINKGKNLPFVFANYAGANKLDNNASFINGFYDAQVINAKEGYVYKILYIANGDTALNPKGWTIDRILKSTLTNASPTFERIVPHTMNQPDIVTGIQRIKVSSTSDEIFYFVIDSNGFPATGTGINSSYSTQDGYCYIIDESCYQYKNNMILPDYVLYPYYEYTAATKRVAIIFKAAEKVFKVTWGVNGANGLPNYVSTHVLVSGSFTQLESVSTDWLPPLIFSKQNVAGSVYYTGGNHTVTENGNTVQTAINDVFQILIDGNAIDMTVNSTASFKTLQMMIRNRVFAANTITEREYALQQTFKLMFKDGTMLVDCENKALVDINVYKDNGTQITTGGFKTTQLMVGGEQVDRAAYSDATSVNSGARQDYPNAFAWCVSGSHGHLVAWVDRNYADAVATNTDATLGLLFANAGTAKRYNSVINHWHNVIAGTPKAITTGQSYKWRGGYSWLPLRTIVNADFVLNTADSTYLVVNGQNY